MREHQKRVLAVLLTVALCFTQNLTIFANEDIIMDADTGIGTQASFSEEIISEEIGEIPAGETTIEEELPEENIEYDMAEAVPVENSREEILVDVDDKEAAVPEEPEGAGDVIKLVKTDQSYENFRYAISESGEVFIQGGYPKKDSEEIIIPASINGLPVTRILNDAFHYTNTWVRKLVIPDSVTRIGSNAFASGYFSTDLVIPDSVTYIGDRAFGNNFKNVKLGRGLEWIGDEAFYYIKFSGDLLLPENLKHIGYDAFDAYTDWEFDNIIYPAGCGDFRAARCYKESLICYSVSNNEIKIEHASAHHDLVIPDELFGKPVTEISAGYSQGGRLRLPKNLLRIGDHAFYSFYGGRFTESLTIPDGVTTIGAGAFENCPGLIGDLTIPDSVTTIGARAFAGCSGLSGNLTIPDGVTSIKEGTFEGCSGLTGELTIPENVATIGDSAFSGCSGFEGNLTIPDSVTTIGAGAFSGCSGFTGELSIPDGVTTIGDGAFSGCNGLTSLSISTGLDAIGGGVFSGCSGLTGNLTIPDNVTTVGD